MTNKNYYFDLFNEGIRQNWNTEVVVKTIQAKYGCSVTQVKKDLVKVNNLLFAVKLYISKAVEDEDLCM